MPLLPRSARRMIGSRPPSWLGYLPWRLRKAACASASLRCDDTCTAYWPVAAAPAAECGIDAVLLGWGAGVAAGAGEGAGAAFGLSDSGALEARVGAGRGAAGRAGGGSSASA